MTKTKNSSFPFIKVVKRETNNKCSSWNKLLCQTGSSFWKRYLSENLCVRDADVKKIDHIMDKIKFNNVDTSVGQPA